MIIRTVDLQRARAAAVSELAGVELLTDAPSAAAPARVIGDAFHGREQLATVTMLMLAGASEWAAKRWGEHWAMGEKEAEAIAGPLLDVIELEMGQLADDPYSRLLVAASMFAIPRVLVTFMSGPPATPATVEPKPLDLNGTGASN